MSHSAGGSAATGPEVEPIDLVRVAAAGHTVLSVEAARRLVGSGEQRQRAHDLVDALTEREIEVLECLGAGGSNQQVAVLRPDCWLAKPASKSTNLAAARHPP